MKPPASQFPYDGLPLHARWHRLFADLPPDRYIPAPACFPFITRATWVASAGSCFAQNIALWLRTNGFTYLVTESGPATLPEGEQTRRG